MRKTTDKGEHTLIRKSWTNVVMQRKREVQNRQQFLAFINKYRQGGRVVKALNGKSNTVSVRGLESHLCRNPFGHRPETKTR